MNNPKKLWMQSLKIGDEVCDCRFLHLKIVSIDEIWAGRTSKFLRDCIFAEIVPLSISDWLWNKYSLLCKKIGYLELYDKELELEDGNSCSAMHCCDPVEHFESHPNEQKTA